MYSMYRSPVMIQPTMSTYDEDYIQYQLWKRRQEEIRQYQAYREWSEHIKRQKQLQIQKQKELQKQKEQEQRFARMIAATIERKKEEEQRQRKRRLMAAAYQDYLQRQQYYTIYHPYDQEEEEEVDDEEEEVENVQNKTNNHVEMKKENQDQVDEDEDMDLANMVNYIMSNLLDRSNTSSTCQLKNDKMVHQEKQNDIEKKISSPIEQKDTDAQVYHVEIQSTNDEGEQNDEDENEDEQNDENEDTEMIQHDEDDNEQEDEDDLIETIHHDEAMETTLSTQEVLENNIDEQQDNNNSDEEDTYLLVLTDDDYQVDENKQQKLKQLKTIQEQLEHIRQSHSKVLTTTIYFDGSEDQSQGNHDAIQVPTINKNQTFLKYEDDIMKILLQLDNVDSEGDERIRKARKDLVKQAELILNELDQYKQSEWEKHSNSSQTDSTHEDSDDENQFLILNL